MKSFRKNTRGQFVIIVALLIALLTLSLSLSIHQVNLHRQQLRYEPVEELVLGITSDLDRCLTYALSIATQKYHNGTPYDDAKNEGYNFISKWVRSVLASYAHLGMKMTMSIPENETTGGPTDIQWRIDWDNPVGISHVSTKFDLDIDAYGFKGWVGRSAKFVRVEILPPIEFDNQSTTLKFQILQGKLSESMPIPIPNLTPESLSKTQVHITEDFWVSSPELQVTALTYLGEGIYSVTFNQRINEHTLGVQLTVDTPEDNIVVSAIYYRKANVFINLQSQDEDPLGQPNLGWIQLGEKTYSLPNSTTIIGPYLAYTPLNSSYVFVKWNTTRNIEVANYSSRVTSVKTTGNGTITAIYKRYIPPKYNLTLRSRDWENFNPPNLGNITIGTTEYTLPNSTNRYAGDYMLQYEPSNSSYRFLWWESTNGAIVWNPYNNPTTFTLIGNGTITAVYMARPPIDIPDPLLLSREDNNASENLGRIQLGATTYDLPNTMNVTAGTYLLEYLPHNSSFTFLNWTTTGSIDLANPNTNPTAVTITGTGTIIAFYHRTTPAPPETVNLTLNSREWGDSSPNLGTIRLDSTNYSLSTEIEKLSGDYAIQFIPAQNYAFLRWETTGNLIAWNSTNSVTKLRILGNGTLTAIYAFKPSTPTLETVALESREENFATQNLGTIQLEATVYNLDNSTMVGEGVYFLEYVPADGYIFVNWTTTGNVTVEDENSSITSVIVNGDGTVKAMYKAEVSPEPPLFELILDSREQGNSTLTHLGNIIFNSTPYNLTASVANLTAGNYPIEYIPSNSSHVFVRWEWTGNVIPWNASANSTILTIYGNATIAAVYSAEPPTTTEAVIALQSLEETSASQDLGQIQLGDTLFVLTINNSAAVINGTYFLKYIPEEGYTFLNWTTTGNITIANPNSVLTSVVIDGNGTITAFYRHVFPPPPEIAYVLLDSKEWDNSSQHSGVTRLNLTNYDLPIEIAITYGDYAVEYIVDQNHVFLRWEATGNIIPYSSTSSVTRLRILGNGTLTAIYYIKPPTVTQASVTLQSLEETLAFPNKGKIQFGDILFMLPNSVTTNVGTYFLEYVPVQGYIFLNWTTTGGITVEDPYSQATNVTVSDNGSIIAFYRGCDLLLNSRHWENLSSNLGRIKFDLSTFTLENSLTGLAVGDYSIQFISDNSSHIFLWWEFSGNLIPVNSTSSITTLRVFGDGILTAVYTVKPTPPTYVTVNLQSKMEDGTSPAKLDKMQLGATIFGLPNSTKILAGSYLLEYFPEVGYTFVRWETTGSISAANSSAIATLANIPGNGVITAIYRGYNVLLNSRHWANSSYNKGNMTLGTTTYTPLPWTVKNLPGGDYSLSYGPENSSYVFLWWEFSADVIPWNLTSSTTTVTIFGNGTITAVYSLISEPPPSVPGEWGILYLAKDPDMWGPDCRLLPYSLLPGQYFNPRSSTLPIPPKPSVQYINVSSLEAPFNITLAKYVNMTLYVQLASGKADNITFVLKFTYNNKTYFLGNRTFYNLVGEGWYTHTIDTDKINKVGWPVPGEPIIPTGSVITLTAIVPANSGTLHIIYGWNNYQSRIELF